MTITEHADRLPPWACRLCAKTRGVDGKLRLMTDKELQKKTGWGEKRLRKIYLSKSFATVTAGDIDIFMDACGIKWKDRRRSLWMLKRALRRGMDGIRSMWHLHCRNGGQSNQLRVLLSNIETLLSHE